MRTGPWYGFRRTGEPRFRDREGFPRSRRRGPGPGRPPGKTDDVARASIVDRLLKGASGACVVLPTPGKLLGLPSEKPRVFTPRGVSQVPVPLVYWVIDLTKRASHAWEPDVIRRLALVQGLPLLALTDEVEALAGEYQIRLGLPRAAQLDVVHLACAVVYELDYLLTWNCAHLANGRVIQRLHAANVALGRVTPVVVTPEALLEGP